MKRTFIILFIAFLLPVVLTIQLIMLFECEFLVPGSRAGNLTEEFYVLMAMELLTICLVPSALWMFRAKFIKKRLVAGKEHALLRWGLLRLLMLAVPMVANTLLYYLYMLPSFGYLAIIIFLSMFFVFPTMERCVSEVS